MTPGAVFNTTFTSKIDWLALATARAGFVVGDKWMLYGKGGLAIAKEQHTAAAAVKHRRVSINHAGKAVHTGAVVGAGGEYAFAPNWSVKAEYDYIKMFAQQVQWQGHRGGRALRRRHVALNDKTATKITQDLHLVKFGVNYHFNP